ncbi:MAG TPA: hypothetical protein VI854_04930, partial [Acidimicrobiia bacterium]|nr:hypothetical protein [Acidimicrobiia bacterium]
MKRFSVALATIVAVLAVGTASARIPDGRDKATMAAGPRLSASPGKAAPAPPVPVGEGLTVPGVPGVNPASAVPESVELPAVVANILGSLPFAPEVAAAVGEPVAAAVAPAGVELPAPVPAPQASPKPAPAPKSQAAAPVPRSTRVPAQVASPSTLFPGLPATGHAAYTTGTVIHADALTGGGVTLTDVELAFSGSTFTSSALTGALSNEVDRVIAPQLGVNNAFGRGSGLEIGLAQPPGTENQVILANKAEAKAPPSTALVSNEVGPVDAAPAVVASLLRGQAQSRAGVACTTDVDLSYGQGYAANVALAADAIQTVAPDPTRGV